MTRPRDELPPKRALPPEQVNGTTLRIRSDPSELRVARDAVRATAEAAGFSPHDVAHITLAVDEALSNVIRHGYGGPCDQPIDLGITHTHDAHGHTLRVVIRDFGKQVNPDMICGRPLDEVRPGGLGVHIIRSVMDEVVYEAVEGGGMRLTLRKSKNL